MSRSLPLLILLAVLSGCSTPAPGAPERAPASGDDRPSPAFVAAADARIAAFRDLLAGTSDPGPSSAAPPLALRPPPALLAPPSNERASAESLLAEITARARAVDPGNLVAAASSTEPAVTRERVTRLLQSVGDSPADRVTIVIVPGIFGEFIPTHAFEEVFARPHSAYRDLWESRLAARGGTAITDAEFSLRSLGERETPLHDLLRVSSIDDARGQPLVNAVIFETHPMSLESLGDITDVARVFSRRLAKFLDVMGPHRNLVLLGYSRGAMIELEMLAEAAREPARAPWLAQIRAAVTLGGVLYGSDLADEAFNARGTAPAPLSAQQMRAVTDLGAALAPAKGDPAARAAIIAANTAAWTRFMAALVTTTGPSPSTLIEAVQYAALHPIAAFEAATSKIRTQTELNVSPVLELARKIGFHTFHIQTPFKDYNRNVRRLKTFVERASVAVAQLGTAQRLAWWRTHVLPVNGIRYYSINATLSEPRVRALDCARPEQADDCTLASSFHQIFAATGVGLNDSQVGYDKSRFWPGLERRLNAAQPPMDTVYLGLLNTHHWGLALRAVNQPKAGVVAQPFNPFPREALLTSIAASVAGDLTGGR